jgi:oxygen-independent coproporphyrinogen-3 oxidase
LGSRNGYTSIGHDIILDCLSGNRDVMMIEKNKIITTRPIGIYSYAHVPWIKGNGQRGFNDEAKR